MGSWSETIMGGDGPMDAEGDVLDLAKFEYQESNRSYDEHLPELKDLLEKVPAKAWAPFFAKGGHERYNNDKRRVSALLLMECGAAMPPFVAQEALKACKEEVDSWKDQAARTFRLKQFADLITNYDGTPTVVPSEGLFDKLAEAVQSSAKPKRR